MSPLVEPTPSPRSPDHPCRIDDLAYPNVNDWYLDHQGLFPITMAHALSLYESRHGCTFAQAFTALLDSGAIVLIEPEETPEPSG